MPRVFTITSSLVGKASIMSRPTLCALVPGAVSSCTVIAEESAVTRHGSISKKTSGLLENARTIMCEMLQKLQRGHNDGDIAVEPLDSRQGRPMSGRRDRGHEGGRKHGCNEPTRLAVPR